LWPSAWLSVIPPAAIELYCWLLSNYFMMPSARGEKSMATESNTAVLEAPLETQPPLKMTYEEFLAWADEDTRAEWVNGEVVFMGQVSKLHQVVGGFLLTLIKLFVEAHQLGQVFYESFQMKTGTTLPGRLLDITFVANENLSRVGEQGLEGPGDLVVEIISPESRARDRGDKFYEYEQGGVREYWLLDPLRTSTKMCGHAPGYLTGVSKSA
jgi:Uma2 family endonuclease